MELRGEVCLELRRRDGRLITTTERDKNKGEVRFRRGKLHVPLEDEDNSYQKIK
jgi:hypothetical protein